MEKKFEQLKAILIVAENDLKKFSEKGNKTAGVRLRKSLQDVKEIVTDIRKDILESRNNFK